MQYWTIVSEMDLETWFYYQPQHTSRRVENLSGCGLDESTTTCLAKLGYDVSNQQIIEALFANISQCLNRTLING